MCNLLINIKLNFIGKGRPEAEPGARLTCHLLLRILKTVESPQPSQYAAGLYATFFEKNYNFYCIISFVVKINNHNL